MAKFDRCPSCGFNKQASLTTGAYFNVYECTGCGKKYCYECNNSNNGKKCPKCGSSSSKKAGEVYLKR